MASFPSDSDTPRFKRLTETLSRERSVRYFAVPHAILTLLRPAERLVLYGLSIAMALSVLILLAGANAALSVTVPADGGSLTEGEVGSARFINPVIAVSQSDQDLTALVYSGLMRALPDGSLEPDLAASYKVSDDGTVYTFAIRPDATFHDGTPVTSADIAFTISKAQQSDIKSPHRADWDSVTVSTPDAHTIVFTLPHAYAPFLANTTIGILPKHLWASVSAEDFPFSALNTHPIGTGPYQVKSVDTDQTGAATRYELSPFSRFTLGRAHLDSIAFLFYPNQEALIKAFDAHDIDAIAGLAPSDLSALTRADADVVDVPLPRVFGVFFNQSHAPVLADLSARQALDAAIDKDRLVDMVLGGKGTVLTGPIPPGVLAPEATDRGTLSQARATTTPGQRSADATARAKSILAKGGWTFDDKTNAWTKKKQPLSLTLATADVPELVATANAIADDWRAAGVQVQVAVYPVADLNTNIIRPREYDALLFGEVIGRELDLFAFWHSTQRMDPGLNLSLYANAKTDTLLAKARTSTDQEARISLYQQFAGMIASDTPAVFLYAPDFLYVVPKNVDGIALGAMTTPAERFLGVHQWFVETQRVWSIFAGRRAQALGY